MSLLDEALRKKNQENGRSGTAPLPFTGNGGQHSPKRTSRLLLIAVLLGLTVGGVWLFIPSEDLPPRRPTPTEKPSATPAEAIPSPAASTVPAAAAKVESSAEVPPTERAAIETVGQQKPSASQPVAKSAGTPRKKKTAPAEVQPKPLAQATSAPTQPLETELPAAAVPFYEKARLYHREGRYEQAAAMYAEVLRRNPRHYQTRLNLASAYLEADSPSQAYAQLAPLSDAFPNDPVVLVNLAIAEIELGRPEKALENLRQAERNGAPLFDVQLHRGAALSQLDRLDEALASYRRAEALRPDSTELRFNLAVALDKRGEYAEALHYYQAYLAQAVPAAPQRRAVMERINVLRAFLAQQKTPANPS